MSTTGMSTTGLSGQDQAGLDQAAAGQDAAGAGIPAEMAAQRARCVVFQNSRLVCWLTMGIGIVSVFMGICMMLMVVSVLSPLSAIGFMSVVAAAEWGLGGALMCMMCPWLWKWGTRMLHYKVKLDARGADFNLGTKKQPGELFIPWQQVTAVQIKRAGNVRVYTVFGMNGNSATYTSNTFFRPARIVQTIAERAGLTIERV